MSSGYWNVGQGTAQLLENLENVKIIKGIHSWRNTKKREEGLLGTADWYEAQER